jgi:hypothetical protein
MVKFLGEVLARRKLVRLSIKETSGVDRPAHLHDGWVVMKSADSSELTAVLNDLRPEAPSVEEASDGTPAEVEKSTEATVETTVSAESQTPQEETMSELLKAAEVVVIPEVASEEEILKAMPTVIKKMLDDSKATAEAALLKAAASEKALINEREARADEAAVIKAAEWSHLNSDPTLLGPALRRLAETDSALANEVVKALDSANALLETNVVFTEVGAEAPAATDDAYSKMESLAKAAVASGVAPSFEAALLAVAQSNPDLYTSYLNEKAGR